MWLGSKWIQTWKTPIMISRDVASRGLLFFFFLNKGVVLVASLGMTIGGLEGDAGWVIRCFQSIREVKSWKRAVIFKSRAYQFSHTHCSLYKSKKDVTLTVHSGIALSHALHGCRGTTLFQTVYCDLLVFESPWVCWNIEVIFPNFTIQWHFFCSSLKWREQL